MPLGGKLTVLTLTGESKEKGRAGFSVSDTRPAISFEDRQHLFGYSFAVKLDILLQYREQDWGCPSSGKLSTAARTGSKLRVLMYQVNKLPFRLAAGFAGGIISPFANSRSRNE